MTTSHSTSPTPKQIRALKVLADITAAPGNEQGVTPGLFGDAAYPETTGHASGNYGLQPYAGRNMAAGSVLARLRKAGLVERHTTNGGIYYLFRLSPAGRRVLAESRG